MSSTSSLSSASSWQQWQSPSRRRPLLLQRRFRFFFLVGVLLLVGFLGCSDSGGGVVAAAALRSRETAAAAAERELSETGSGNSNNGGTGEKEWLVSYVLESFEQGKDERMSIIDPAPTTGDSEEPKPLDRFNIQVIPAAAAANQQDEDDQVVVVAASMAYEPENVFRGSSSLRLDYSIPLVSGNKNNRRNLQDEEDETTTIPEEDDSVEIEIDMENDIDVSSSSLEDDDDDEHKQLLFSVQSILPESSVFVGEGAQQVSFSYRHDGTASQQQQQQQSHDDRIPLEWRFTLYDSQHCDNNLQDCSDPQNLQAFTYSAVVEEEEEDRKVHHNRDSFLLFWDRWITVHIPLKNPEKWKKVTVGDGEDDEEEEEDGEEMENQSPSPNNNNKNNNHRPSHPKFRGTDVPSIAFPNALTNLHHFQFEHEASFSCQTTASRCYFDLSQFQHSDSDSPQDDTTTGETNKELAIQNNIINVGGFFRNHPKQRDPSTVDATDGGNVLWIVEDSYLNELVLSHCDPSNGNGGNCVVSCFPDCSCIDSTTNAFCATTSLSATSASDDNDNNNQNPKNPPQPQQSNKDVLDLKSIKGWRIDFFKPSSYDADIKDDGDENHEDDTMGHGTLWIDQISLEGPGELFGAAWFLDSWEQAEDRDVVAKKEYPDPETAAALMEPDVTVEAQRLGHGTLLLQYQLHQPAESLGGYVAYDFTLPGRSYYNVSSRADVLAWNYDIPQPASVPGRVHMRLKLLDSSNCPWSRCGKHFKKRGLEMYYSFQYILDGGGGGTHKNGVVENSNSNSKNSSIEIELWGNSAPASPLWRTGWDGSPGNDRFDKSYVKGYQIEIVMDSKGGKGSFVSGAVELGDLKVMDSRAMPTTTTEEEPETPKQSSPAEPAVAPPPTNAPTNPAPTHPKTPSPADPVMTVRAIHPDPLEVLVRLSVDFHFAISSTWPAKSIQQVLLWVEQWDPRNGWGYVISALSIDHDMTPENNIAAAAAETGMNTILFRMDNVRLPRFGMFRWWVEVVPVPQAVELQPVISVKQHFWIEKAPTLAQIIAISGDLSVFRFGLRANQLLLDEIDNDASEPYTIFAPTNDAFTRLGEDTLSVLFDGNTGKKTSQYLLQSHVIKGKVIDSKDFPYLDGKPETSVSGSLLEIRNFRKGNNHDIDMDTDNNNDDDDANDDFVVVKGAGNAVPNLPKVVVKDIYASNGIIHIIDAVINPYQTKQQTDSDNASP